MTAPSTAYLICYDVSESPRRLVRLHRRLAELAVPIQYSVFCGLFTPAQTKAVLRRIAGIIDARKDDVRLYPVPRSPSVILLGRPILPEGLFFNPPGGILPATRGSKSAEG